ncbi:MAG TPA: divalent-cation tolerance protein CutA [Solirubrobacterales bacterium]|jgi:periplasmic divalent cation tolerance protein|nr:divalent-cation tolerance protein CutA [Solirubrobacterales bacterium]
MATEVVQVLTTAGSEGEAARIAELLVERRLAACVQVMGPIVSRYRWQGAVEEEREWQCLAKTTRAAYEAVEAAIREVHSYDEPEIVATEIVAGSAGYLAWIEQNVS